MTDRKITLEGAQPAQPRITIREHEGVYLINFAYDQRVVDLFKRHILPAHRSFKKDLNNGWLIHPDAIETACLQFEAVYGGKITRPAPIQNPIKPDVRVEIFRVEYVGSCHQRMANPKGISGPYYSAYGAFSPKVWGVEFPEEVLKSFFGLSVNLNKQGIETFYQILLVQENCDFQSLKSAHRRLVRQWHPDLCKEPDANDRFRAIQEAYEILCDPIRRRKYDAGLFFERQNQGGDLAPDLNPFKDQWGYRSPLTSGLITVKGIQSSVMTRFLAHEILSWEDLKNDKDQVAVSSWKSGQETYQIIWR